MTEDHKALIERITESLHWRTTDQSPSSSELKDLLALARRGAAADSLAATLNEIVKYTDLGNGGFAAHGTIRNLAKTAIENYIAATQSTASATQPEKPLGTLADQLSRIEDIVAPPLKLNPKLSGPLPRPAPISGLKKAGEALAMTQSTEPVSTSGPGRATSTPGEAASVAGGPIPLVADGHPSVTEGADLGWKISATARDKIMELMRENVRSVSDLHSIILASLSEPCPDQPAEGEAS